MKRRLIAVALLLCALVSFVPLTMWADDVAGGGASRAAGAVYVASDGSDENGDGSEEKPYATLRKAVEKAESGDTVYVMSDLTAESKREMSRASKPLRFLGATSDAMTIRLLA